jgi:presenilin-like A22 family membrane protease
MDRRRRAYVAGGAIVGIFLLVQLGALALVEPFKTAGYQPVENPQNPTNSLVYVGAILVATAAMLVALRLDVAWLLRAFIVFSGAYLAFYVFSVLLPDVGWAVDPLAVAAAGLIGVALYVHPEWYVIDAAGVVMGAGGAALFGISFGVLPALILLVVLAVYDAISVYGTEHMLTLASGVMDLKVPVILVIPLTLSYSFLDAEPPETASGSAADDGTPSADAAPSEADGPAGEMETDIGGGNGDGQAHRESEDTQATDDSGDGGFDRDAIFIGLGDAVIPTVLVASAGFFATGASLVPGIALTLPALAAMVGTLAGLVVLLWMVLQGRAHAGLPLLNGGTVLGYIAGALAAGIPLVEAVGLAPYL